MPVSLLSVGPMFTQNTVSLGQDISHRCHHYLGVCICVCWLERKELLFLGWQTHNFVSHSTHCRNLPTASLQKEIVLCSANLQPCFQKSHHSSRSIKHVFSQRNCHLPQGSRTGIGPVPSWSHRQRHDLRLGHLFQTSRQHVTCIFGTYFVIFHFFSRSTHSPAPEFLFFF